MSSFAKYEKIQVGDVARLEKTITEDDVKKFVALTGDDNPLHVDRRYAEQTPFKGIVVHGMLGASFLSTLIGTKLPGEGALWVSQNFDFLLPVRLGDHLSIESTVTKKHDKENLIELSTTIRNQNRQLVVAGTGKVKIIEMEKREEAVKAPIAKVAIVTGGVGGLGSAICRQLAKEGYKITVNYRSSSAEKAESLGREIGELGGEALLLRGDITNSADIEALVNQTIRRFGGVSVLVNNASPRINPCKFLESEWSDFQKQIDVQVRAAFELTKRCALSMKEAGSGSIINISSQVIDGVPTPSWSAYALAKEALSSLTKSAALELGPMGIRVNQVSPGMVETALVGDIPEKNRLMIARQTPLRKLAQPEDVAEAVVFLASSRASHITGETFRINGGAAML